METIHIQNLKCGGCANTITKNLSEIEGVTNVNVIVEDSVVQFNPVSSEVTKTVKDTLKKLGYPEDGEVNSLGSKAKSFVSCAVGRISK